MSPRVVTVWAVMLGYAAAIFWVSGIPARSMPEGSFWKLDKLIHAAEFGILAALIFAALRCSKVRRSVAAMAAAGLASVYGVSDELHQSMVPGRFASPYDVLADIVGACAAAWLLWWWSRRSGASTADAAAPADRG